MGYLFAFLILVVSLVAGAQVGTAELPEAVVSVDSTFYGYNPEVLTDGKWIEQGLEDPNDFGPDRLGNTGNTWASSEEPVDHWIRLDWLEPVTLDEIVIWWSVFEWYPNAFRIEQLQDENWVPIAPEEGWLTATDRKTVIPLPSIRVQAIRVLQPESGGGSRDLMAAQEISAFNTGGSPGPLFGARHLTTAAFARLTNRDMRRNIALLDEEYPGASWAMAWSPKEEKTPVPAIADGDLETSAAELTKGSAVGIEWPIAHMIDGAAAIFCEAPPDPSALQIEFYDGHRWRPLLFGQDAQTHSERQLIEWTFEPTATHAIRMRSEECETSAKIAEMEVYRDLPNSKFVWADRYTKREGLKQEVMGLEEEPSFEIMASCALPMRTARALLGLKDTSREVGVGLDGTIESHSKLEFMIGPDQRRVAEFHDTITRDLIDGWRPGVIIRSRIDDLEFRETAFVAPMDNGGGAGFLLVRISLLNRSDQPVKASVEVRSSSEQTAPVVFANSALTRNGVASLVSISSARPGDTADTLCIDLNLDPGQERSVLFVEPQDPVTADQCRNITFDDALARFRQYWDGCLSTTASFEVPESRINLTAKAVLAQCFVTGEGDVMPYGAGPSVYDGALFGIEESYPMLSLALFGFGPDAQRYLDGTFLTEDFLHKNAAYEKVEDRHQQYRNGLQPHYAVSAYRLTRDRAWIEKHLSLLKDCAEWTITERRKSMTLEDGKRPLHWGLLPKWSYGGDIFALQCYALYANLCCWRGLVDTAWLLEELGDHETACRYADEAQDYRKDIDLAIEGNYQKDQEPPFLPLRLYTDKPDEEMDYYQLFSGCLLDIEPFAVGSKHLRWITDYLEQDNRTFCFLPRFRHVGPGALDAIYGKGHFLTLLHEDSIREFLLAFYTYLATNMEQDVFTSRETNVLYTSDLQARSTYGVVETSDPLTCGNAVALQLIRHMLITEQRDGAGGYSGGLMLLMGTPRAWFEDGKEIRINNAPTHFGNIDLEVASRTDQGEIEAVLTPPTRNVCKSLQLRLRHPEGERIQTVTVNGKEYSDFDPDKEWIMLPGDLKGPLKIVARYN